MDAVEWENKDGQGLVWDIYGNHYRDASVLWANRGASLSAALNREYKTFSGMVTLGSLPYAADGWASLTILGDGKELWNSS